MNCCDQPDWGEWTDLGSVDSFDFLLGRCAACGSHVMNIWRTPESTYLVVAEEDTEELLRAAPGLEAKKLLRHWFNRKSGFWDHP
jgi:hypothetical protein